MVRIGWCDLTVSEYLHGYIVSGHNSLLGFDVEAAGNKLVAAGGRPDVFCSANDAGKWIARHAEEYENMLADFAKLLLPLYKEETAEYVRTLLGSVTIL